MTDDWNRHREDPFLGLDEEGVPHGDVAVRRRDREEGNSEDEVGSSVNRQQDFATVFWGVVATEQAVHLSILAISFYWLSR